MIFPLEELEKGIFKIDTDKSIDNPEEKLKEIIDCPDNFVLSFRASDNSFHEVNSDVSKILSKNLSLLKKGISLASIAADITSSKDLRIKRYLIWKNKNNAFFVGETLKALKKVASTN